MSDLTVLTFGNANPQVQVPVLHPEEGYQVGVRSEQAKHLSQSVTRVNFWPGVHDTDNVEHTLSTPNDRMLMMTARVLGDAHRQYAVAVYELEQIIAAHSAGDAPKWVSCSDAGLQAAAAAYFDCAQGEPTALFTTVGRDALHSQHLNTAAQPAAFNYMALTASVTAPAAADTVLTGEITTAGGGLLRAQATYAHTGGTNTTTLTKTFTANGSDSLPVTVAQIGIFNAASVGTLGYHTALSSTATLSASGDSLTPTETVTAA